MPQSDGDSKDGLSITEQEITLGAFLETCPPNELRSVDKVVEERRVSAAGASFSFLLTPEIQLHCDDPSCDGVRFFRFAGDPIRSTSESWQMYFVPYRCDNCKRTGKTFAIAVQRKVGSAAGFARKIGETPPFGPPTPARLIKLIGPDRDLFLRGRRCENQGLGIGAFVYYRRVVERQKSRILSEILKVAEKLGAAPEVISDLRAALEEDQFKKAIETVKHGIPQALLIDGHNPLLLLHGALSEGLHDRTDEECLQLATSVRVVLAELSDRLSQALKDEAEINAALAKLLSIRGKPSQPEPQ